VAPEQGQSMTTDPATTARKIGLQLFKLQLANRDIGREIERLQVELESIDFDALVAPGARKARYRIKAPAAAVRDRESLLTEYRRRYKQGEAVSQGWERGHRRPWSIEALCETHSKSFDVRSFYRWQRGELDVAAKCSTTRVIENALRDDIARMKKAGVQPTEA
jgi:hypothetical protein